MSHPRARHARPHRIRKHRITGVYTTHAARRLRRRQAYRVTLAKGTEYGKDVMWGALFFTSIWIGIIVVAVGGLVLFG